MAELEIMVQDHAPLDPKLDPACAFWFALFGRRPSTEGDFALASKLTRIQDADKIYTTLDAARVPWYLDSMIKSARFLNCKHMTRFGWAVEGVAR